MNAYELSKLQDRASIGDVNAVSELIDFYLSEHDLYHAKMEAERLRYISSPVAYRKLALISLNGLIDKVDVEEAKKYFKKAYDLGDEASGYNLALLLIKENEAAEAIPYLTYGVSNNHIPSIKLLANLYFKGEVVTKDLTIAISLLKKVYELGEISVVSSLGKICYQMKDYDEAFKYFSLGAQQKDLDSIYYLGVCYASGTGVKQDFKKSKYYYEVGANLFEPRCLYNLSLYYRNGVEVEKNDSLADKLYQQALENGFKK